MRANRAVSSSASNMKMCRQAALVPDDRQPRPQAFFRLGPAAGRPHRGLGHAAGRAIGFVIFVALYCLHDPGHSPCHEPAGAAKTGGHRHLKPGRARRHRQPLDRARAGGFRISGLGRAHRAAAVPPRPRTFHADRARPGAVRTVPRRPAPFQMVRRSRGDHHRLHGQCRASGKSRKFRYRRKGQKPGACLFVRSGDRRCGRAVREAGNGAMQSAICSCRRPTSRRRTSTSSPG